MKRDKQALQAFERKWDRKYPSISKSWRAHWQELTTFLKYPAEIRKAIYTTNAIESLNRSLRKISKNRGVFPHEESLLKLLYMALERIAKKWTMPIHSWSEALNRFAIEFGDRMPPQICPPPHEPGEPHQFDRRGARAMEHEARPPARFSSLRGTQAITTPENKNKKPFTQISLQNPGFCPIIGYCTILAEPTRFRPSAVHSSRPAYSAFTLPSHVPILPLPNRKTSPWR